MGKDPADIREPAQDANRDPLTGEAGSHPVGTGIGPHLVPPLPELPQARLLDQSAPSLGRSSAGSQVG